QFLEYENKSLREALAIQKKLLKRGRHLPLDHPDEYHGEAVFWSPHSVQRARDRQHQKDTEEQQIQLQKSEQAEARRASQQLKARLLQERRIARAAARDARAKQRADEAADRRLKQQARRAQSQLQRRIKLSQKGNKKASKLPSRSIKKEQAQREAVDVDNASSVASASQSRSGRTIKTPSRNR
ncbi:hypothetical protein BS50DRAFT_666447, partial [Corynespora cassiicola Philippines]